MCLFQIHSFIDNHSLAMIDEQDEDEEEEKILYSYTEANQKNRQ